MKINYLFLISFFFCLPILAQFNEGTVTLIDGTEVTGLVKVNSSSIKFKKNSDSKTEDYDYQNAKSAKTINKKGEESDFEFVLIENDKKPTLLKVLVSGNVKLYTESLFLIYRGQLVIGTANNSTFYLKRQNEERAQFYIAYGYIPKKNFKDVVKDYFVGCTELQKKVANKEFKKDDYAKVVTFYNENCGK